VVKTARPDLELRPRRPRRFRLALRGGRTCCAWAALATACLAVGARAQPDPYVPGRVIVKFAPATRALDVQAARDAVGATVARRFPSIGAELWMLSGMAVPDAVEQLRKDASVVYADPDYILRAHQRFPNDPRFGEQWGLHNTGQSGGTFDADVDAPEAWELATGGSVLVGVIDTGVDWQHEDLAANIFANALEIPGNQVDDDGNGFVDDVRGWDFLNDDNDPADDNGHGTHVAGIVAAVGGNAVGIAGVCWSARILPLKFLSATGAGPTSAAILALEYAVAMGARVVNASWGNTTFSVPLRSAIEAAGQRGVLFVAAAGNVAVDTDVYPNYPSGYDLDHIISVAATDHNDRRSAFSNYGVVTVDLGAPGTDISSTIPGNRYFVASGTSMAAPHVAGAACLMWSADPTLAALEVKDAILSSVDELPVLRGRVLTGGRLNLNGMLSTIDYAPPDPIPDLTVRSVGSNTVDLAWTATGDDGVERSASIYHLRYATAPIDADNFDRATPVPGLPAPKPAGSPESFTVAGLAFHTTYYFALVAEDDNDLRSALSNVATATTLGAPALEFGPDAFTADLYTGGVSVQRMTVMNVAEGTLDFAFVDGSVRALDVARATAPPPWARVNPSSGRVHAGQSLQVEVTFDATGLGGGDYAETVTLSTNDPNRRASAVVLSLHVTDASDVTALPATLDFGVRYAGTCATDSVVVTNIGTLPLVVDHVASVGAEFAADAAGFVLAPEASRSLPVTFCPVSAGTGPGIPRRDPGRSRGQLVLATNDPDHPSYSVPLYGEAREPPVVSVSPASFAEDVFTGGVVTRTLTVSNSGATELDFAIATEELGISAAGVEAMGAPSLPSNVAAVGRPLSADELERLSGAVPKRIQLGSDNGLDRDASSLARGAGVTALDRVAANLAEVFGSDANEFFGGPRTRGNLFACSKNTTLREHRFYMNPTAPTEMWFVVYEGEERTGVYQLVAASDATPGGPGLGWYSSGAISLPLRAGKYYLIATSFRAPTAYYNARGVAPYPVPASFGELTAGAGWSWQPYDQYPPAPYQFVTPDAFGEPVAYYQTLVTGGGVRWLSLDEDRGTVLPGLSLDVAIRFDAAGVAGGEYDANVRVASNDPFTPELVVPARVRVTGAPDIVVSKTTLDFGAVYVGAASQDTVVISNAGTEFLFVSAVTPGHADYSVASPGFVLAPGARRLVVATFAPSTAGLLEASLTISSTDPDENPLIVSLRGEGRDSPTIAVTPRTVSADLGSGEVATRVISISNTGGNDLAFRIETALDIDGRGASKRVFIPHSDGNFPRGSHPPATGRAPRGASGPTESTPSRAASGGGVAFATETQNFSAARFHLDSPEALHLFGFNSVPIWAGDFGVGDNAFAYAVNELNLFVRVDTLTGAQTLLGTILPFGTESWSGMALDPTDGSMYATSTDGQRSSLYTIDVGAPAAARIGAIGFPSIVAVAIDSDGKAFGLDVNRDELVAIDKATGKGTAIGSLGFDSNFGQGMAFDRAGERLYISAFNNRRFQSELRVADRHTGATAVVSALGVLDPGGVVQLGWLAIPGLGGVPWLRAEPRRGVVPPGASADVAIRLDASKLIGGDYLARLAIRGDDVAAPEIKVPARVRVTGIPDIVVSVENLDYGAVFVGGVAKKTLLVSNTGTDILTVRQVSAAGDFAVDVTGATLAPGASRAATIAFAPTAAGERLATLAIRSDDPDESTVTVALRGDGVLPPVMEVTPGSLTAVLAPGEVVTRKLTIDNSAGAADLVWNIGTRFAGDAATPASTPPVSATSLETILASLEANFRSVTAKIPNRWDFFDGEMGHLILDGGYDMFDGGNILGTDRELFVRYSDGVIAAGPHFGPGGRYFTRKYPGLFVLAAEMEDVNSFQVLGNLGADGEGSVDGAVLQARVAGTDFTGFVKRVFGALDPVYEIHDPSVNHLIIVQESATATHEFAVHTEDDFHRVFNLAGTRRLYHLLYAGWDGFYIDDTAALDIMVAFLKALGLSPGWMEVSPLAGVVPAGGSVAVDVTLDSADLAGDYESHVVVAGNDPLRPEAVIPVHLAVGGGTTGIEPGFVPTRYALHPNRPNPFNPVTTIAYDLPRDARVRLVIYDVRGAEVRALVDARRPAGRHLATWDGRDAGGNPAASGVYFYRLVAGDFAQTNKMVLLK
jgi:subtilisin family serine protease